MFGVAFPSASRASAGKAGGKGASSFAKRPQEQEEDDDLGRESGEEGGQHRGHAQLPRGAPRPLLSPLTLRGCGGSTCAVASVKRRDVCNDSSKDLFC